MAVKSSQVVKLSDAIFTLQVYQSDIAGIVQDIHDVLKDDTIGWWTWYDGRFPANDAGERYDAVTPTSVLDWMTMFLGFGVHDQPRERKKGIWIKRYLNDPPTLVEAPGGTATERMSGQALSQSKKRASGIWRTQDGIRDRDYRRIPVR